MGACRGSLFEWREFDCALRTGAKAPCFFTPAHFASLHKRAFNGTKPAGTGFVITKALCSHGNLLTIDGLRPWGTRTHQSPIGFPRCLFAAVLSFGAVALTQPSLINLSNALPRVLFSVLGVRCSCPHTLALECGHACGFGHSRFFKNYFIKGFSRSSIALRVFSCLCPLFCRFISP